MATRLPRPLALVACLFVVPVVAGAQDVEEDFGRYGAPGAFDVQLFEPSPSPEAITTVDLPRISSHLSLTFGLWVNDASRPWVVEQYDPSRRLEGMAVGRSAVVDHLSQSELHAALGLFEYFELGLAMPVVYVGHVPVSQLTSEPVFDGTLRNDLVPGDLRTYVKVPVLRGSWPVAVRVGVTFPTSRAFADTPDQPGGAFAGNRSWTFTPAVVVGRAFGRLTVAGNLGVRWRERNGLGGANVADPFVLDDEIVAAVGAHYALHPRIGLNAEITGRVGISEGAPAANRNPVELWGGATFRLTDTLAIQVGGGRGLTSGYGTSEYRLYAGVRGTVTRASCTYGPEDYDGFEDGDYCADPDNDGDRVADAADRCPNDPEDRDGFLDDDGCADPDNDADGVLDDNDRCPVEPEDHDGYNDTDGCPEGDNDRDGIADGQDDCPMEPEDPDNYQDQDGCPEPGPEAVVVTRTESHLLLSQRIFFDYDSDVIRPVSLPILNEVALTLRRNPDITRVRVEGYTDGQGDPQYNLDLSYRRARAVVEYLVSQGVPRDHLEYVGYGASHPVADDSTPEGQALNRRVEFTIVRQGGQDGSRSSNGSGQTQAGTAGGAGRDSGAGRRHRRQR